MVLEKWQAACWGVLDTACLTMGIVVAAVLRGTRQEGGPQGIWILPNNGGSRASPCQPPHCVHSEGPSSLQPVGAAWLIMLGRGFLEQTRCCLSGLSAPPGHGPGQRTTRCLCLPIPPPSAVPAGSPLCRAAAVGPLGRAGPDQTQTGFSSAADGCSSPSETTHSVHPPLAQSGLLAQCYAIEKH